MDKKLVLELTNHNVFYIKDNDISYYITIPKTYDTTNICVELKSRMSNYNLDMNDELWVMENVKTTFSYIDNYNITLVLPILNEEEISVLEKLDTNNYQVIDKILGRVINDAYLNLKEEGKEIENQIILINNERFKSFINWFITRYKERVINKTLLEVIQAYNVNATAYKTIKTAGITYVVGSYNNEVNAPKIEKIPEPMDNIELKPQFSTGFTSYWLLIALVVIIAAAIGLLIFLYK